MAEELTWCDPPGRGGKVNESWSERLLPLMERPGSWAMVPGLYHGSTTGQLNGRRCAIPPGRWQFKGRHLPDLPAGRVRIWAMYLGPEE